jgi:paraquat-inducible protein B
VATRVQPWLVGFFALFGLALMVGGFVLLGTGRLFSQYRTFVVFFEDPVGGLKEGSPVTFRLTPVGQVREMELVFSGQGVNSELKIIIDVRKNALRDRGINASIPNLGDKELAEALVKAGLRAGIYSSSPVAGQKSLNLDFLPERKARFSGIPSPYPEIPTAPSGLKMLQEKIENTIEKLTDVPINEVVIQLKDTLASAQKLLDSQDVKGAVKDLRQGLQSADKTLTAASKTMGNVDGLVGDLRTTVSDLDTTIKRLDSTFDKLDRTLTTADKTLSTVDKTLVTVDRTVDQTMDIQYDAKKALDEMNELLRSVRHLIETMQKSPESILRGKPTPEKK